MDYGYIRDEIGEDDWLLGSGKATKRFGGDEINPGGDWSAFDPEREIQRRNGLETSNCSNFGTNNALIALSKFLAFYDFPQNISERYTGVMTGTTKGGNSPHKVIEIIRSESGVIDEEALPWTEAIRTWEDYYSPNPMSSELVRLGKSVLKRFKIGHEWVFHNNSKTENKHELLKQALKRGTVCVSVKAWDKKGSYYVKKKGEDDNHWVWLTHFDGDHPVIRDHYTPFVKTLSTDYDFERAKLYFLSRHDPQGDYLKLVIDWAVRVIKRLAELLIQKGEPVVIEPPPLAPPDLPTIEPIKVKTNREILYDVTAASLGKRMIMDRAVPDRLGCASSLSNVLIKAGVKGLPKLGIGSTAVLHKWLLNNPQFEVVTSPLPGDIISSPTGTPGARLSNGHMGIVVKHGICSNNSDTGLWSQHWTLPKWIDYYSTKGRIPTTFFRFK